MISFFPYSWVISHCVYIPHFFFNHLSMVFSLLNRTFENFHSKYVCTQLPTFLMLDIFRTPFKFAAWWLLIKAKESIQNSRLAIQISSVTQSCPTLRPHELQHARPPCPSPTPGIHPNPCPSSRWMPPNHLILCCPLFLLPWIFPSIRVFSNESALRIRWPKSLL